MSKRQAQRAYTLWFHLRDVQEPTKLIYIDRNQNNGCLGILEGGVITEKGHKKLFGVKESVSWHE